MMTTFLQLVVAGIGAGAAFSLIGIGLVLVYRTTGIINFGQGLFAVVAGLTTAALSRHVPVILAALVAVVVVVALAFVIGLIAPGRRTTTQLASLIVTIGLTFICSAVVLLLFGDDPYTFAAIGGKAWNVGGTLIQPQYALIVGLAVAGALIVGPVLGRTLFGHSLVACADSRRAAELIGLNVRMLGAASFALAGLLAAIGGIVLIPVMPFRYDSDITVVVNAFVAAVFGGLVSVRGAFLGGLVLGVAESLVSGYISGQYNLTIALILMLVVMVFRASRQREVAA